MAIVKEEFNHALAREWAAELNGNPLSYAGGVFWVVDKERKAYLAFQGQDREMNDDGSVVKYFVFFYQGKIFYLHICFAGGDDEQKMYYYGIRNNNLNVDLFNQAKEFGIDAFFTIYN